MSADRPALNTCAPRLRSALLWVVGLGAGVLLCALCAREAPAQSPDTETSSLFGPRAELVPRVERFQRATSRSRPDGRSRFGDLRPLGRSSAAGTTGFDATNTARRRARAARRGAAPAATPRPDAGRPAAPLVPVRPVPQPGRRGAILDPSAAGPPLVPSIATPTRRRPATAQDPFEPLGLRSGALTLWPAIELSGGYDSNPSHTTAGRGSSFLIVAPELKLRSDWERHALSADVKGTYTAYSESFGCCNADGSPTGAPNSLDRPTLDSKIAGRIDITRRNRLELEGRVQVGTDNPGSPNLQAQPGLARLPIYTMYGGTLGYVQSFNRFEVSVRGTVDRRVYQQSLLTDGTTSGNGDRNYNQYAGILRGSYELLPGVKPFVEVNLDTRVHDVEFDRTQTDRDSDGQVVRAGSTFEFSRMLSGEISAGYLTRRYKDPSLRDINGFVFDASLIWAATPLTTLTLTAKSTVDEIIIPDVSGALRRDFGIQVDHALRRWLVGTARFGYGLDDYIGMSRQDRRFFISTGLVYKLNRELWLKSEYRRDWLKSDASGVDYTADLITLGMRLQR